MNMSLFTILQIYGKKLGSQKDSNMSVYIQYSPQCHEVASYKQMFASVIIILIMTV